MRGSWQDILALAQRQGVVTPNDVKALGLAPENLNRMAAQGLLIKVGRGIFEHPEFLPTENHSYVEVAKSVPKGVICLISALSIHGVGTQMPWEVWVAVPRGQRQPAARLTKLRTVTMSGAAYDLGIQIHEFEGVKTKVYSLEKSIVDCFRLRRLIGHDAALEALKEAMKDRKLNMNELINIAAQLRARNLIEPYLEALT
jgi:predicted transcriptional regulator of viral defense system